MNSEMIYGRRTGSRWPTGVDTHANGPRSIWLNGSHDGRPRGRLVALVVLVACSCPSALTAREMI